MSGEEMNQLLRDVADAWADSKLRTTDLWTRLWRAIDETKTVEAGIWFQGPNASERMKDLHLDLVEQTVTIKPEGYMVGPFVVNDGWTVKAEVEA